MAEAKQRSGFQEVDGIEHNERGSIRSGDSDFPGSGYIGLTARRLAGGEFVFDGG
jgi:hypothetical protein